MALTGLGGSGGLVNPEVEGLKGIIDQTRNHKP